MRRTVLLGLCLALMAPGVAMGAGSMGYQYLTTYSGTYDFTDNFRAAPNAADGDSTQQWFQWVNYDYQTIVVNPDHTYTQTLTSYIRILGGDTSVNVQGSGLAGGPFTTTSSCHIYSDSTPVVIKGGGDYIQPVSVGSNPLIQVGWMLPDYGAIKRGDVPPIHVSGTADCPRRLSTFLFYTPSQGDGTVFAHPQGNRHQFNNAFSGTATIHYAAIEKHPWARRFAVTLKDTATRPGFQGPSVDSAKVVVNSRVSFERTFDLTLPDTPKVKGDKIADSLINEGFGGLGFQGAPGGPPVGASGDPDTVVIPGFGPGQVSLDVTGTVLSGPARDGAAAAAGRTVLASARTLVRRGGAPVRLTIIPTAAGRRLLKAPHRAFAARYTLSFRPAGSRRTYRGVRVFTVPAQL